MKKYVLLFVLFLSACATLDKGQLNPADYGLLSSPSPKIKTTSTPYPTPTLDYYSTAQISITQLAIAQATADEARRLNTQATAEFEGRQLAQAQMTAEIERQEYEIQMLTATMAATSIPLTQTQQAVMNTQIPMQQALMAAQLTSTKEAPTQIVAMRNSQIATAIPAPVQAWGQFFMLFCLCIFLAGIGVFAFRAVPTVKRVEAQAVTYPRAASITPIVPMPVQETVIRVHHDTPNPRMERFVIPCRPEQFTAFAEGLLSGAKKMAFKYWEQSIDDEKPVFTRDEYQRVRLWMQSNKLALSTGQGNLIPTADLESLLQSWLEQQQLPTEYEFETSQEMDNVESE